MTGSRRLAGCILSGALLVGGLGVAHPSEIAAQERAPAAAPEPRGWIGISYDVRMHQVPGGIEVEEADSVVVTGVVPGSPAHRAGVRPGDAILELDGRDASHESFARLARGLRPGERVVLRLARDGETRTLELVTDPRPTSLETPLPPQVLTYLDSMRSEVLREMDSLRFRFRTPAGVRELRVAVSGDTAFAFRTGPGGRDVTVLRRREIEGPAPEVRFDVEMPSPGRGVRFRELVGPELAADSTREDLRRIREETMRTRMEASRLGRSLARISAGYEPDPEDEERIRSRLEGLRARDDSLRREMGRVQRRMADERVRALEELRSARSAEAPDAPAPPAPLMPYVVGRSYVAGAQLTSLNPGLSDYFGVEDGVLVTEVVERSPAAESGLRAGDVIVAVGGSAVGSLQGLRRRLARARSWPVSLSVVRKGERLELGLTR